MKSAAISILVGLCLGFVFAAFIAYRFPVPHQLRVAKVGAASFQDYLLETPATTDEPEGPVGISVADAR